MMEMPDPTGRLHPLLRPRFPFFGHRTMAEIDETERLEQRAMSGRIFPYEMMRLRELQQKQCAA